MNHVEEGSGIKMTLIVKGEKTKFNLVVLKCKSWTGRAEFRYQFVNEEKGLAFRSPYSGGNTGFGQDVRNMTLMNEEWHTTNEIVARSLEEIARIVDIVQGIEKTENEEYEKNQNARVAAINAMPTSFKTCIPGFEFFRSKAEYKGTYSRSVQGGDIVLTNIKNTNFPGRNIWIEEFTSKNGRLLVKKFEGSSEWRVMKENLPEGAKAKEVLRNLAAQRIALKQAIRNA